MSGVAGESSGVATKTNIAVERDWDILLDEIDEGEVIPVIGQDLLTLEQGGHRTDANLDFARQLRELLELDPEGEATSVAAVAAEYVRRGKSRGDVYDSLEWLVRNASAAPSPESLCKLAEITPFRVFVTTNFDHWMEQALSSAGRSPVSLAYEPGEHGSDLPKDHEHRSEAFVYHLLGRPGDSAFAVLEDDILEFMHQLLSPASPRRPQQLFDALERSDLLFLGCRFPDWLTRFFVRMARGVPLGDPHGRRNWIVGGTVEGATGEGLKEFLATNQRTKIFKDHTAGSFVAELHQRWKRRHPEGMVEEVVVEPKASQKVFLSYASEDRPALKELCAKLDELNVLYWFDRDELKAGNDWDDKIRRNVRSCCLFVPLISENVATKEERYFRIEWDEALDRQKMQAKNSRFVLPVLLDGASWDLAEAEEVRADLQKLNWMEMSDFLEKIVGFYRDKQRDRIDGRGQE